MVREYRELDEVFEEDAVRLVFRTGKPVAARRRFVVTPPMRGAAHDRPARRPARSTCAWAWRRAPATCRLVPGAVESTAPSSRSTRPRLRSINPASTPTDCRPVRIAAQLPATEQSVGRLPAAVPLRPIRPRTAGENQESDALDRPLRLGQGGAPAAGMPPRSLRGELSPYPRLGLLLNAAQEQSVIPAPTRRDTWRSGRPSRSATASWPRSPGRR
jgi:hypothetical protein